MVFCPWRLPWLLALKPLIFLVPCTLCLEPFELGSVALKNAQ